MTFILKENRLFKKRGHELIEVASENAFKENVLAYFYGAKWCSDCEKFAPVLREFYNSMKANEESFEVVFISSDKTEEEMREFVLESHGDWLVFYKDESCEESANFRTAWDLRDVFAITGIPSLIVTKKEDEEICSMDGVHDLLTLGNEAMNGWKQKNEELLLDFEKEDVTHREPGKIVSNCCRISQFKPWVPTSPIDILSNNMLLKKADSIFRKLSPIEALEEAEIVAFYFASRWCGACDEFVHNLRKCYEELQEREEQPFEIVFVSSEETEEETKELMEISHGDWLALHFGDEEEEEKFSRVFAVQVLPTLRVVNKKGELVSKFGVRDIRIKGASAYDAWCSGSPATTAEEEKLFWTAAEKQNEEQQQ